jgi:hypothetical protein
MDGVMTRATLRVMAGMAALCLSSSIAMAQQPASAGSTDAPRTSRAWVLGGGMSTTLLGDCTGCESDTYLHTGGVIAGAGVALNPRTDLGAEILWIPTTLTTGDDLRATYLLASVRFRPWRTRGFFVKAGSGIAFLKNWLATFDTGAPPLRSKAFALDLGAGWEWRVVNRLGVQVFGAQHVAALGDLETSERTVENVIGNFWSVGGAIVIR